MDNDQGPAELMGIHKHIHACMPAKGIYVCMNLFIIIVKLAQFRMQKIYFPLTCRYTYKMAGKMRGLLVLNFLVLIRRHIIFISSCWPGVQTFCCYLIIFSLFSLLTINL